MKKIINLLFPIILIALGFQFTRDYFGAGNKQQLENYEKLVSIGQTTLATLDPEYVVKTIKVFKIPVKTYEVSYTFTVNN